MVRDVEFFALLPSFFYGKRSALKKITLRIAISLTNPDFIEKGIGEDSGKGILSVIRRNNERCEDVRNAGCWVIGDPEFVRKVLAADINRRARMARYQKDGLDVFISFSLSSFRT